MTPGPRIRFTPAWLASGATLLASGLVACSVAPIEVPRGDAPQTWRHIAAKESALGAAPDLHGWWRAFHDAELDRLVDESIDSNLTLSQATYRIAAARAMSTRAAAAFAPEIGAHTFSEPAPDSSASYFQAGFDAKWEFGLFGRAASSARAAEADIGLAEVDAYAARVTVVAEVARVYVELRGAERRLAVLSDLADAAKAHAALIATRERLRLASAMDSAAGEAECAVAEAALLEPKLAIDRSRQQLAVLLGKSEPLEDEPANGGSLPTLGALRIGAAPADLLRTRPEIRRAELAILKAAGELGVARSDLFPRLALGGSLTYSARVIGHTRLADADSVVSFGPLIDLPIFDWGARRDVVNAREAALQVALYGYRQAVVEGVADVESALAALACARARRISHCARLLPRRGQAPPAQAAGAIGLGDANDSASAKIVELKLN